MAVAFQMSFSETYVHNMLAMTSYPVAMHSVLLFKRQEAQKDKKAGSSRECV